MMKYILAIAFFSISLFSFGQTKKLHRNVSNGIEQEIAPKISADGNTLVFLSKSNRGGPWTLYYAKKKSGKWGRSDELPGMKKHMKLMQFGGFSLNADGSILYFSSKKHGGVGGYDLWQTTRVSADKWTVPVNLYKPINSAGNDCSPSITADGNYMYFTRCTSGVDAKTSECCKIYVSERKGKAWGEAKALPSPINTGCESSPFMHPDGKTLYFASKRAGGKGDLDLYVTRKQKNGKWVKPIALDFLNTPKDDQYIAMDARGHVLYYAEKKAETFDLYATILEEKYRAEPLLKFRLRLKDENGARVDGFLRIKHPGSNHYLLTQKIKKTDYQTNIYLSGKGDHDFTIYGADDNHFFFSEEFNLDSLKEYSYEKRIVVLAHVKRGREYPVHLYFDKDSVLSAFSKEEIQRIKKIALKHKDKRFSIEMRVPIKPEPVVEVLRDSMVTDTVVEIKMIPIELTPEEKLEIGQKNSIRAYCNKVGLTEKRFDITIREVEGIEENKFVVLIK